MNQRGFTFMEIFFTLILFSILLAFTVFGFTSLLRRNESQTTVSQLVHAIEYTRLQAMTRHQIVSLCPSHDGKHCSLSWQDGLIVMADTRSGQKVLRKFSSFPSHCALTWNRNSNRIQFDGNGTLSSQNGSFKWGGVKPCETATVKILLSQTGRIRVER